MTILSAGVHAPYKNWKEDPELAGGSYGAKNAADAAGLYNDIIMDSLRLVSFSFFLSLLFFFFFFFCRQNYMQLPTMSDL